MTENPKRRKIRRFRLTAIVCITLSGFLLFGSSSVSGGDCSDMYMEPSDSSEMLPHTGSDVSLKDTLSWLAKRVPEFSDFTYPHACWFLRYPNDKSSPLVAAGHFQVTRLSLSGCNRWQFATSMTSDESLPEEAPKKDEDEWLYDFSPKEYNPQTVTVLSHDAGNHPECQQCSSYSIELRVRPDGRMGTFSSVYGTTSQDMKRHIDPTEKIRIGEFGSHEQAERIGKALRHALELCGGDSVKADAF